MATKNEEKKSLYRNLAVSVECHQKVRVIASLEGQMISEWLEWMVDMAYQAAMRNRKRPHLSKK